VVLTPEIRCSCVALGISSTDANCQCLHQHLPLSHLWHCTHLNTIVTWEGRRRKGGGRKGGGKERRKGEREKGREGGREEGRFPYHLRSLFCCFTPFAACEEGSGEDVLTTIVLY